MKAKFVRGQDPKASMDIGVNADNDILNFETTKFVDNVEESKYLGWGGWELDKEALDLVCAELDVPPESVLAMDPYVVNDTKRDELYSKAKIIKSGNWSNIRAAFSDKGLIFITEKYDSFIIWILGVDYRLTESTRFERGMDPKDAMGIGDRVERDIQKIDKFISKFGFERIADHANTRDNHLEWLAEWANPNMGIYLTWHYYPEMDKYFFYTEKWGRNKEGEMVKGLEYEGSLEELFTPGVFQNILDGEPMYWKIMRESVNFERGRNPKSAIGIGGAAFIPEIPKLIFIEDNKSPLFIGGGRAIDNIRRIRTILEVKFFTNPLLKFKDAYDKKEYDKMEYLKSILEDIGVLHMFEDFSYTDNMARVRCRIKEPFLLDFVKELDEDEWYTPEQYGIE